MPKSGRDLHFRLFAAYFQQEPAEGRSPARHPFPSAQTVLPVKAFLRTSDFEASQEMSYFEEHTVKHRAVRQAARRQDTVRRTVHIRENLPDAVHFRR